MPLRIKLTMLLSAALLSACASTSTFKNTWKDPDAAPLEFKNQKVAAVVLLKHEPARRLAENRLAQQIAVRGAQGRPMHRLLPDAELGNEQATRAALEAEGVKGVIVMRPVNIDREVRITQPYQESSYASFWGGTYGTGFAVSLSTGSNEPRVSESMTVYIETLVYSLSQNKLVWAGQSKATNPDTITDLVEELSAALTTELQREGLIKK